MPYLVNNQVVPQEIIDQEYDRVATPGRHRLARTLYSQDVARFLMISLKRVCLLLSADSISIALGTAESATPTAPNFSARRDYLGQGGFWVNVADTNGDRIP